MIVEWIKSGRLHHVLKCPYVAARASEIGDGPFTRTILNEPVVMFRTQDGIVALEDRCCHRPLSPWAKLSKTTSSAAITALNRCIRCLREGAGAIQNSTGAAVRLPGD